MLVATRLCHIAATKWGTKRYLATELATELAPDIKASAISGVETQTEAAPI